MKSIDEQPRCEKLNSQKPLQTTSGQSFSDAKRILAGTLRRWPEDGFALLLYGYVLKHSDKDYEMAAIALHHGLQIMEKEGRANATEHGHFYIHLGEALQRTGAKHYAKEIYQRGVERKLFPSVQQRSLYNVPGLRAEPWWTIDETGYAPFFRAMEASWMQIRDEAMLLITSGNLDRFHNDMENLLRQGNWRKFELFRGGQRHENNCRQAPFTCSLIEQFPAARKCRRGQVKFSLMQPGTRIWPHCGPTNCRLRAHLGLIVPDNVYLRVANKVR